MAHPSDLGHGKNTYILLFISKTRRVSPVDNIPFIEKLHHSVQNLKLGTYDTWYVTLDTWHVTGGGRWSFPQNFSSLALTVLGVNAIWRWFYNGWSTNFFLNQGVQDMAWKTLWAYLEVCRAIKSYLEPFEAIWSQLKPFGANWSHLDQFGAIWSYFEVFEALLKLFWAILSDYNTKVYFLLKLYILQGYKRSIWSHLEPF